MLFEASRQYAPGQPRGDVPESSYQDMNPLGRYNLAGLQSANVWLGLLGLVVLVWLIHKYGGRKR